MKQQVRLKWIGFNLCMVLSFLAICIWWLFGVRTANSLSKEQVVVIALIGISVVVFFYYNSRFIKDQEQQEKSESESLLTAQDYILALGSYSNKHVFHNEIITCIGQIEGFVRKQEILITLLYKNFSSDDQLTGIVEIINNAERLLFQNMCFILDQLQKFEEEKYEQYEKDTALQMKGKQKYEQLLRQIKQIRLVVTENTALSKEFEALLIEVVKIEEREEAKELSSLQEFLTSVSSLKRTKKEQEKRYLK